MVKHRLSLPALAAVAVLGLTAAANATVFIGLQQDAGAPVVVHSGPSNSIEAFAGSFGNFETMVVTGFGHGQPGNPLPQLLSSTINVSNNAGAANAGTLKVYVVSTGNTPAGAIGFKSGLTAINLPQGWTETVQTYLDPNNGAAGPDFLFTLGTPLGSAAFNTVGSDTDITVADTGSGPFYSVTAVYTITAPSFGTVTADAGILDAVIVPEPGALALLGAALAGFGVIARRRRGAA